MKKVNFYLSFFLLLLGFLEGKSKLPNIVIILADDMGSGDISYLNRESKIKTPYLDELANEGTVFTNAHSAASVCVPSRYGLITGRLPWRKAEQLGLLADRENLIELERQTLPDILKVAGYETAAFGKWHLGWHWPYKDGVEKPKKKNPQLMDFTKSIKGGPLGAGFDTYYGVDQPDPTPRMFIENDRAVGVPKLLLEAKPGDKKAEKHFKDMKNKKKKASSKSPMMQTEDWDIVKNLDKITDRVVSYIDDKAKQNDKPFFIYFALTSPHNPVVPKKEFQGKSGAGPYGDFVMQSDDCVGRVLSALESHGMKEDTLIIFSSDNGSNGKGGMGNGGGAILDKYGHRANGISRGYKGEALEGGHRVPFIARWPEKVLAGARNDGLISLLDFTATFASLTGQTIDRKWVEDSENVLDTLLGKNEVGRHSLVEMAQRLYHVREGRWKLILGEGSGGLDTLVASKIDPSNRKGQLYDLKKDPGEERDLFEQKPEVVERLRGIYLKAKETDSMAKRQP